MSASIFRCLIASLVALGATTSPALWAGEVDLPRFPSVSPDGSEVVFSWSGDLWRVPIGGGEAVRLTRNPLDDLHASWSPDGMSFPAVRRTGVPCLCAKMT